MGILKSFIFASILLGGTAARAQVFAHRTFDDLKTDPAVLLENLANNSFVHEDFEVELEHYEIPVSEIEGYPDSLAISADVQKALIFERDGKKWLRWIINPADRSSKLSVARRLSELKLSAAKKKRFKGILTASRSFYVLDPETGVVFSVKTSTDRLFEARKSIQGLNGKSTYARYRPQKKSYSADDARYDIFANQVIKSLVKRDPPKHCAFIYDVQGFGFSDAYKQGMIVRSTEPLVDGPHLLVPAFSILHEKIGVELSGQANEAAAREYWRVHLAEAYGRAAGEIFARYGLSSASPHAQNFFVEFDRQTMKPTGRIIFRDVGEFKFSAEYLRRAGYDENTIRKLATFPGRVPIEFWLLGFTNPMRNAPSWLSAQDYDRWAESFYRAASEEIGKNTEFKSSQKMIKGETAKGKYVKSYRMYFETVKAAPSCKSLVN